MLCPILIVISIAVTSLSLSALVPAAHTIPSTSTSTIANERIGLHQAVIQNSTALLVQRLLNQDSSTVNTHDSQGYSPLHYAAAHGNVSLCALLLQHNANPNNKNSKNDNTPAHNAFTYNDWSKTLQILFLLHKHGAHLDVSNKAHETPMLLAIAAGFRKESHTTTQRKSIINFLLFNGITLPTLIKWASFESNCSTLETRPLYYAIHEYQKNKNLLFQALENNDTPTVLSLMKVIPLMIQDEDRIVKTQEDRVVKTQDDQQKETPITIPGGNTPLHYAVWKCNIRLIRIIMHFNPLLINIPNKRGQTPICEAVAIGQGHYALAALMGWDASYSSNDQCFTPTIPNPFPKKENSISLAIKAAQG